MAFTVRSGLQKYRKLLDGTEETRKRLLSFGDYRCLQSRSGSPRKTYSIEILLSLKRYWPNTYVVVSIPQIIIILIMRLKTNSGNRI